MTPLSQGLVLMLYVVNLTDTQIERFAAQYQGAI